MQYTFAQCRAARTINGSFVYVPDQVYTAQKEYDGLSFPVMRRNGTKTRAILRGDKYGLWTTGTGDPVVALC